MIYKNILIQRYIFLILCCTYLSTLSLATELQNLRDNFISPNKQFTQIPFWFWNDEINEDGILRQIEWMEKNQVYGFIPHARMGLSRDVGYMSERWLELIRYALQEAKQRDMTVYLYDEGMYPSGSAHGKVVEGNPELASQGLRMQAVDLKSYPDRTIEFPLRDNEKAVAAVVVKKVIDEYYDASSVLVLDKEEKQIPTLSDGDWQLIYFIQTPSDGVIRGVHWGEEDRDPGAPRSADLLNLRATERFIEETHNKYFEAVGEYFGDPVAGMFTDEPSILGRRAKRGLKPWTHDFLETVNETLGYDFTRYLPFLWVKANDGIEEFVRSDYRYAVDEALNERFYKPLSVWCEEHGIALTGHPDGAGDISPQKYFHHPGQDTVWRWVMPGKTSLEEEQSVQGIAALSAAVQLERPWINNECYGAYGWRLTPDEMKWLADWLFVRGTNRLIPHAFYYSIREKRKYERPPDLGWFNLWEDHYPLFSTYTNRMSYLLHDINPSACAAIFTTASHTSWKSAKLFTQNQTPYHYLDESFMPMSAIQKKQIALGKGRYPLLVIDQDLFLTDDLFDKLHFLLEEGIPIVCYQANLYLHPLRSDKSNTAINTIIQHPLFFSFSNQDRFLAYAKAIVQPVIINHESCPNLRTLIFQKKGIDFCLVSNEGESPLETNLMHPWHHKKVEIWDAEKGTFKQYQQTTNDLGISIRLAPRESRVLCFTDGDDSISPKPTYELIEAIALPVRGWDLRIDHNVHKNIRLGSWINLPGLEKFSGTGWYSREFTLTAEQIESEKIVLDLGELHAWATVWINNKKVGTQLWRPFEFSIEDYVQEGENHLRIGITNTLANAYTDEGFESGLLGPVYVRIYDK